MLVAIEIGKFIIDAYIFFNQGDQLFNGHVYITETNSAGSNWKAIDEISSNPTGVGNIVINKSTNISILTYSSGAANAIAVARDNADDPPFVFDSKKDIFDNLIANRYFSKFLEN